VEAIFKDVLFHLQAAAMNRVGHSRLQAEVIFRDAHFHPRVAATNRVGLFHLQVGAIKNGVNL
jgi:hypothetical protein